ncbi:MAG: hypothetical protein SF182_23020 [Deltaproteobacteria bacterium]|nr:hypothetical protein [Deltaproteobacteria bacterium]
MSARRFAPRLAAVVAVLLAVAGPAAARPLYFDTFTSLYGLSPGDDLYACGVCHRNWNGTGARNPFGVAIEQQLYISKPITDAILAVESADTDGDGFSNVDEITVHGTLPGYACDTFDLAFNTPVNFQSLITPGVPSCLEPKDIRVTPADLSFVTEVGGSHTEIVTIANYGQDDPITVSSAGFFGPHDASLSLLAPAAPFVIPVGGSATLEVTFTPTMSLAAGATLRIVSDDPDEPTIDLSVTALGIVIPRAPAPTRAACLGAIDKQYRKYAKTNLSEWTRCLTDEVSGRACDVGRRDLRLQAAEERLRSYVGGSKDKLCAGASLSPTLAGLPTTCPAPCDGIAVTNMLHLADCLVCTQAAVTDAMLSATYGVTPPDLPPAVASLQARSCQKSIAKAMTKGILGVQKTLAACELANITAGSPIDCQATHAADLADAAADVDGAVARCKDSTGLQACVYQPMPDPMCLSDTAVAGGVSLVGVSFGVE